MAIRKHDGSTPYSIHPVWCAMTILAEEKLPRNIRELGAEVLLNHDVPEDTTEEIPDYVSEEGKVLISEMIFADSADEMQRIWTRSKLTILFKLYDKVSNWLDSTTYFKKQGAKYYYDRLDYLVKLTDFAEENFGNLNIVIMARAIEKERRK